MTIWGGFTNHLRIGLDISTDGYDTYTPSINVYLTWYVQVDSSWNFNDSETLVMTSPQSDSWTFQNTMGANGIRSFGHTIFGQGQNYGGGPTYNFSANLQGVYLGAGPSFSWNWALPPRPIRPPAPPAWAPIFSSVTSTSFSVQWGGSADFGGSTPDQTWLQLATDAGFGNIIYSNFTGGFTHDSWWPVGGLTAGTTYYARAAYHNAAGWSGWSGTGSSKTLSGAKIRSNGAWVDAVANVRVNGAWNQAQVFKRVNGLWVQ